MYFSKLSEYFQKLESTASRNEMVVILARLFAEASTDEIDKVVYLTQGRVAPLFEAPEFGMAEKMVIKAMVLAFKKSVDEVTALYKKSGDLGTTAQELNRSRHGGMTVAEVFEKLTELTKTTGEGSVDKKVEILARLLQGSDPCSARFIARIPVDKMRLGFSDMTVLEGLSWMIDGTKKHKDRIEAAYNVRPDLGFIAKAVKENRLENIGPKVGTPILGMRAERLTNAADILEKMNGRCAVEPKLDGLRTQLHFSKNKVKLYSRGLEDVTAMYPDLVMAALKELDCDEVILDGEALGYDPQTQRFLPFQETVTRKRKYDVDLKSQSVPLRLVVFDCLYYNGQNLINKTYHQRREIIEGLLKNGRNIVCAEMTEVDSPQKLENFFKNCLKRGFEGIMAKKLDGIYQAGARGWNWIKLKKSYESKIADTIDAVVMGYDFGQGKRNKFGIGAFLIGVYDKKSDSYKTVSKVGTGLTDLEWKELVTRTQSLVTSQKQGNYDVNKLMNCDVWISPKIVGEFKADELTKSPMHTAGFALRFPRLEKWRTDKKPEDTTNLQEILELANLK